MTDKEMINYLKAKVSVLETARSVFKDHSEDEMFSESVRRYLKITLKEIDERLDAIEKMYRD